MASFRHRQHYEVVPPRILPNFSPSDTETSLGHFLGNVIGGLKCAVGPTVVNKAAAPRVKASPGFIGFRVTAHRALKSRRRMPGLPKFEPVLRMVDCGHLQTMPIAGGQPSWETIVSKDQLGIDINSVARLSGTFRLRSGRTSTEYFDKYRFESDPLLLRRVAQRMLELVPAGTEVLAGLELGGVPIATAMSLESGLPAVFVRKAAKEYGTCQAVEGVRIDGRKVVLVEDVVQRQRRATCQSRAPSRSDLPARSKPRLIPRFGQ
jgi:hypothetical protein